MGLTKRWMLQQQEQGWRYTDKWVCGACVDENALRSAVEAATVSRQACSFCGESPAAPLGTLMRPFVEGLRRRFEQAIDNLYPDDDFTATYDKYELVDEYAHIFVGEGLAEAVTDAMDNDSWVESDFAVPHHGEQLIATWAAFCEAVKFETRYTIWLLNDDDRAWDEVRLPIPKALHAIAEVVVELDMIRTLPAGSRWWRAQPHGTDPIEQTAKRLGTVPAHLARQPNRMSPPGIPMFYGAKDEETAIGEVTVAPQSDNVRVTWAAFETSRDCRVLDLTRLPAIPSLFDPEHGNKLNEIEFLHRFVRDLSSKARSAWEAVDYVPTQVLTEFFLRVHDKDHPVSGLVYSSAVTDRPAIVLDIRNEQCLEQQPGWENDVDRRLGLGLVAGSLGTRSIT